MAADNEVDTMRVANLLGPVHSPELVRELDILLSDTEFER